jgi:hypothetical protein
MDSSHDAGEQLHKAISGDGDIQNFIKSFVRCWIGPNSEDGGYSTQDISIAEERLGVRIPQALEFVYKNYGTRKDVLGNQDKLLPLDKLEVNSGVLIYRVENQACARWGISMSSADKVLDPPVLWESLVEGSEPGWRPFFDRLSFAVVEMFLSAALYSSRTIFCDSRPHVGDDFQLVSGRLSRMPLPSYPLWAAPDDGEVSWFSGYDQLVRLDGNDWLWACGRTQEALDELRSSFPGEWLAM